MKDNEIIKALENCIDGSCEDCPMCSMEDCFKTNLEKNALDLIKRQKAEIESLKEALKDLKREMKYI